MATNGARGRTRDEMAKLLGIDNIATEEWNQGEAANISFESADAADRINRWVSDQTEGKIQGIIQPTGLLDRLILLNAVYFRRTVAARL